jgi:hypothetical protein
VTDNCTMIVFSSWPPKVQVVEAKVQFMEDKAVAPFVLILMYKVKLGPVYGKKAVAPFVLILMYNVKLGSVYAIYIMFCV